MSLSLATYFSSGLSMTHITLIIALSLPANTVFVSSNVDLLCNTKPGRISDSVPAFPALTVR